jgi:hypothetical protein
MRLIALYILLLAGLIGCGSAVKENSIINAIGATNRTSAFTYVGLGLFTIGAFVFATVSRNSGLKLIACGAVAGAVPYVVQSAYFSIIVSGALLIALLIALYHLWWKVKRSEQNAEEETKS